MKAIADVRNYLRKIRSDSERISDKRQQVTRPFEKGREVISKHAGDFSEIDKIVNKFIKEESAYIQRLEGK